MIDRVYNGEEREQEKKEMRRAARTLSTTCTHDGDLPLLFQVQRTFSRSRDLAPGIPRSFSPLQRSHVHVRLQAQIRSRLVARGEKRDDEHGSDDFIYISIG